VRNAYRARRTRQSCLPEEVGANDAGTHPSMVAGGVGLRAAVKTAASAGAHTAHTHTPSALAAIYHNTML